MATPLEDVSCASLPSKNLEVLSDLRHLPGILVALIDDRAWVRWNPAQQPVLSRVLPVSGVELFERRGKFWFRPGHRLPTFNLPIDQVVEQRPLSSLLFPAPIVAGPMPRDLPPPVPVSLVRDHEPRPATALSCDLEALGRWAEFAFTKPIETLLGARSGRHVILLGSELPPVAKGQRYWGQRLLVPLGFRPAPSLAEAALCGALRIAAEELAILDTDGLEIVPRAAFRPLSRASIRLALRESWP